jgi:hypothetical protein
LTTLFCEVPIPDLEVEVPKFRRKRRSPVGPPKVIENTGPSTSLRRVELPELSA